MMSAYLEKKLETLKQRKVLVKDVKEYIADELEGTMEFNEIVIDFSEGEVNYILSRGVIYPIEIDSFKAIFSIKEVQYSCNLEEVLKICMIVNK